MTRSGRVLAVLGLVALAVTGGGAAAGTAAKGKGPDPAKIQKLKSEARGSVAISSNDATEYVAFVRAGRNGDLLPKSTGKSPAGKANDFIVEYGDILGLEAGSGLVRTDTAIDRQGAVHLTYKQVYKGLPVFGASVKAHVDAQGDLTAVNGTVVPVADLSVAPRLSAGQAAARAIEAVAADPPKADDGALPAFGSTLDLRAESTELLVYRTGLIRGGTGIDQLAYRVDVTNGADVREVVIVHANAGKVLNRYSLVHDALHRVLYEVSTANKVWEEGDPFPGVLNLNQQNIVKFSEDSYLHFFNAFGRDSYDGAGAFMQSVNNDPRINCPNANWNGITTNYCNGVTSDDVVAHEWGHAYTQFTHNLIYQWQPGALNESYSDIWGELVDLINGEGTDAPAPVRTVGNCSSFSRAAPGLFINSPAAIAGECPAGGALFGPALTGTGTTADVVVAIDGTAPDVNDGCEAITNGAALAGKIALINRGTCAFTIKVKNAQNAGAIGAVIANVVVGQPPTTMSGVDPTITIPSVNTTLDHGNLMKGQLALGNAVNVTMKDKAGTREPSYRWLMGEDSTAFGGAIRDMWNPRCLSDPGKVTDAEYHCDVSDQGGVHTNSGVPNHGFALLVDGGTYNGRTVAAIGLTKAAHLYWRAQSVYQTEGSKFPDHADALEASCTDLIGINLTGLSTGAPAGPSGQAIGAADCAAVTQMIAAIELRTNPAAQCNFQPLLKPGEPDLCAGQKNPPVVYEETFEDGLAGWSLSNQGVFSGWPGLNWQASSTLPGGRSGTAAFAVDPDAGNCDQGAGDVSGVMRLTSPSIALPNAAILSPRLTFRHYVATEANFDGGNLKISVNGGPFELVPASAFIFNAYNTTLTTAAGGNTNPLAGQPAFSGTDGGEVFGSWGLSQVNLTAIGISPGDTIQLRFDFGMDGCAGIDGWYVDDVKVQACNTKKALAAKP
jgi:Zn-dependent metalloprotease